MPDRHNSRDLFYRRLDVDPGASRDEIVHAYRRLAHEAHPDAHPGDPDAAQRFREITEAYEVLADPSRRARYDRTRAVRPIRLVVRAAESGPSGSPRPLHDLANAGPTVFLGTTQRQIREPPLRAGPVQVKHPSKSESIGDDDPERNLLEMIARIVHAWGRDPDGVA